ncbi:SpoIIE family protein phosphatase [Streptomyces sp. WMMB 714]|uniref:SpoIIE family protein phosphatase n=1 Tax=Streptomyces sp. WMMB 714 TaxID=1286822 RepID=UPI0020C7B274|nr:SpoIIE family protein phosphatase [Streptomyces sp. WMMB 714]
MAMWWGEAGGAVPDDGPPTGTATGLMSELSELVPGPDSFTAEVVLPGETTSPWAARTFVGRALHVWGMPDAASADAVLLASELVTNVVVHAGTGVRLECRHEGEALVVEVEDRHPTRAVETRAPADPEAGGGSVPGYGLRLVAALAEEWGVSYRRSGKTVWFRLPWQPGEAPEEGMPAGRAAEQPADRPGGGADGAPATVRLPRQADGTGDRADAARPALGEPDRTDSDAAAPVPPGQELSLTGRLAPSSLRPAQGAQWGTDWVNHGILSFLAEASDLLAGQTDEDRVASLAGQLLVPRFADWCAVWLADADTPAPPRLARVWHSQEDRMDELRAELEKSPPALSKRTLSGQAVPLPWPGQASAYGPGGAAVGCRLAVGGRTVGSLVIGRAGLVRLPDEVIGIVEDFARRVALAVLSARRYTRQATISRVLQRGLLPTGDVAIPGVATSVVYEPAGEGSWAGGDFYDFFEVGDGRWRFALGDVCGNGPEAAVVTGLARPVLRLLAREGYDVRQVMDRLNREVGEQTRFLSLVYGELAPLPDGGVECTLVCAGHPLPLVRTLSGEVRAAAEPQLLLGVVEDVGYESQSVVLRPGETLLCVTDGVTERRSGARQFDDGDGLSAVLAGCGGLSAAATAERVRRAVHDFGDGAPVDDLAMLVLRAREPRAREEG